MCGCDRHHDDTAPCTCLCVEHLAQLPMEILAARAGYYVDAMKLKANAEVEGVEVNGL